MTTPGLIRPTLTTEQWRRVFERYDASDDDQADMDEPEAIRAALAYLRNTQIKNAPETREFVSVADSMASAVLGLSEPKTGGSVGRYRLLELIAQGGMGSVWRGERADGLYKQEAAIKLLGSLAMSSQARARFIREGELLAKLNHPSIARLIDVGLTEDGQRFLVLELIEGDDIAVFCRGKTLRDKLAVFRQLLSAVAYSHSQLVLHRDIKPANVLVDHAGQVKLLDFGVAKLADDEADDEGLTRAMGRALTERYAAPEQFLDDNVGTAADVFALGSLLVELLSEEKIEWSHPKKEWVNPSLAVSLKTTLANVADDLRAIARKATSRESSERYGGVNEFDDDIARFLFSEPVRARPASAWYRFAKFVRRHRATFGMGITAALAVVTSLVFAVVQLFEAREKQALAQREAERANAVSAYLTDLFDASDLRIQTDAERTKLSARDLLDIGAKRLESSLDQQPETKVSLFGTLAEIYAHGGDRARSDSLLDQRIALAKKTLGFNHPAIHDSTLTKIWSQVFAGEHAKARTMLDALDAFVAQHPVTDDGNIERAANRLHVRARIERGAAVEPMARVLERYEAALTAYRQLAMKQPSEHYAATLANYAVVLHASKKPDEALVALDAAIMEQEKIPKRALKDSGNLANSYSLRGQLLGSQKRYTEAFASLDSAYGIYQRSYGASHPMALTVRLFKAKLLHTNGQRELAWKEIDEITPQFAGPLVDEPVRYEPWFLRGQLLIAEDRKAEAAQALKVAQEGWGNKNSNPRRLKEIALLLEKMALP